MILQGKKIAIIGLGYVGLPLAVTFAEKYKVIGFDINENRVNELNSGHDETLEVNDSLLNSVLDIKNTKEIGLHIVTDKDKIADCNIFIVTVPTPTDKHKRPVLTPMIKSSESIASVLKNGDIVIYESTVYPGVTEEEMVPILERVSGLKYNQNFYCGYSPERINPGDKEHTVTKILKITSGSTPEIAELIDQLYKSVITAGTHKASSIKVAEAAKVIENSQRDINIAFVNELAIIFSLLGINTNEVLEAAGTKWNFLNFKPGLVGGHCIGVDPYYLAQKAQDVGYHPEIILAGRRLNDQMGKFVVNEAIKLMIRKNIQVKGSSILVLGFTFKENCPDFRNTKVIDIIKELESYHVNFIVVDPWAKPSDVRNEYHIEIRNTIPENKFDAIILAVGHNEFSDINIIDLMKTNSILYDVKGFFPKDLIDGGL
ncbi:MAG: nucleotide sugar dehydrogenase [Flavobacteriaceae bacterium]|nr:nucleotide sugar dehydrogenase [Flavobacteriaceae bacterium]